MNSKTLNIILGIVVLVLIGWLIYSQGWLNKPTNNIVNNQILDNTTGNQISLGNSINSISNNTAANNTIKPAIPAIPVGWKTFSNKTDGYTIQYPQAWTIDHPKAGRNDIAFYAENGGQWQFEIVVDSTSKTLQQNADAVKTERTNMGYTVKTSNTTIDGQVAIKLFFSASEGVYGDTETLVVYNGKLYSLFEGLGSDQNQSAMLKSFQFIS